MCPLHEYKDINGEWTKWVVERLDDDQRKAFEEYK